MHRLLVPREVVGPREDGVAGLVGVRVEPGAFVRTGLVVPVGGRAATAAAVVVVVVVVGGGGGGVGGGGRLASGGARRQRRGGRAPLRRVRAVGLAFVPLQPCGGVEPLRAGRDGARVRAGPGHGVRRPFHVGRG